MTIQSVANDMPVNILDNTQLLEWIKKWDIYPYQFMEAYHAVKVKTIFSIEQYLASKGLIEIQDAVPLS